MPEPLRSRIDTWLEDLERRHLADLTWPELRRGVQALSQRYVQKRESLREGKALDGAGKRAAFAMFYSPLHFLLVHEIVAKLGADQRGVKRVVDLGCGTASGGAAWALALGGKTQVTGIDVNTWVVAEARRTLRFWRLRGTTQRGNLCATRWEHGSAVLAAFSINELEPKQRDTMRANFLETAAKGSRVLIVEPIAKTPVPWWDDWAEAFVKAGGRDDTWKFSVQLPELLQRVDKSAGLRHNQLKARTLYL